MCTRGCCSAGLRPAPAEAGARATAKARATATAGFLGPVAGDAVNPSMGAWSRHPCRSHPCHWTHPAFDSFLRSVGTALGSDPGFISISDRCVDQGRHLPADRGNLSEAGRCPTEGQPLTLTLPWLEAGAGRSPAETPANHDCSHLSSRSALAKVEELT